MTATSTSADAMQTDSVLQPQRNVSIAQAIDEAMVTGELAKGLVDGTKYISPFEVYDAIIELKKTNKIVDEVTPLVEALRNSETDFRQQVDGFVTGSSGPNPNELIRSLSNRVNAGLTLTALMNERHNRQFLPRTEVEGADVLEGNVITMAKEIAQIKQDALELKKLTKEAVDKDINDRESLRANMQEEIVRLQLMIKSSSGMGDNSGRTFVIGQRINKQLRNNWSRPVLEFKSVQGLMKLRTDRKVFNLWMANFRNVMKGLYGTGDFWELMMEAVEKNMKGIGKCADQNEKENLIQVKALKY